MTQDLKLTLAKCTQKTSEIFDGLKTLLLLSTFGGQPKIAPRVTMLSKKLSGVSEASYVKPSFSVSDFCVAAASTTQKVRASSEFRGGSKTVI